MNSGTKLLIAGITGAVAGAVGGILFAPDKGDKTRQKLNKQAKKAKEDLENLVEKGKETLSDIKEEKENVSNGQKKSASQKKKSAGTTAN